MNGRKRAVVLAAVFGIGAFLVVSQLSGSGRVRAQEPPLPPPETTLECAKGDLVLTLHQVTAAGGRQAPTARAAMDRQVLRNYPGLRAEAFRQARAKRAEVEFVHERQGARVAGALVERAPNGGWAVETFAACNSVLLNARGAR